MLLGTLFRSFIRNDRGATVIEYAMIGCLLSMGIISIMSVLSDQTGGMFEYVRDAFVNAVAGDEDIQ